MRKPLILVKHSLPEIVENLSAREWKLSDEGRIRAQQLAERLIPFRPDYRISSVEPKAKETIVISLFASRLTGAYGWSLWNKLGLASFIAIDVESNTLVTRENFT
jgi:broad specificity phosphatase PhoE